MSPTEKQIDLVEKICKTLNINFPKSSKEFTKYTYWLFIKRFLPIYFEVIQEVYEEEDLEFFSYIGENCFEI